MNGSSKILEQIISNQRPANDKTRIGYKYEILMQVLAQVLKKKVQM